MSTGPKFTSHEREAKIAECSSLYLSGKPQVEIAAKLGISQQQVSSYLKTLQKRWQAQAGEAVDARKARELARLDRLEAEHWAAWERSCQNSQTTVNRAKTVSLKDENESGLIELPALEREWSHTERGQAGDPRFLEGVAHCIELRLKIVGGFAPTQVEIKDWRDEARAAGVDPDALVADLFAKVPQVGNDSGNDPA